MINSHFLARAIAGVTIAALASPAIAQFDGELTAEVSGFIETYDKQTLASLSTDVLDGVASGALLPNALQPGVPTGSFEFSISAVDNITREVSFSFLFDESVVPDGSTFMGEPFTSVFFDVRTNADPLLAEDDAILEVVSTGFSFSTVDDGFEPPSAFDAAVLRTFSGELTFGIGRFRTLDGMPVPAEDLNINGFSGLITYRVVPAPGAAAMFGLAAAGACVRRRKAVTA